MIIHLREHEARHFAQNKELLVVRPVPNKYITEYGFIFPHAGMMVRFDELDVAKCFCNLGKPGDVVDCKEAWGFSGLNRIEYRSYPADKNDFRCVSRWYSPATMPPSAIRPEFRGVKVEAVECKRVEIITDEECRLCGWSAEEAKCFPYGWMRDKTWESRYGKTHPWDKSWAWFVKLRRG